MQYILLMCMLRLFLQENICKLYNWAYLTNFHTHNCQIIKKGWTSKNFFIIFFYSCMSFYNAASVFIYFQDESGRNSAYKWIKCCPNKFAYFLFSGQELTQFLTVCEVTRSSNVYDSYYELSKIFNQNI